MPDHRDLVDIDPDTCWQLLRSAPIARVGFTTDDGAVHVLPVNHVVHGNTVAWLSATGTKLAMAARQTQVAVEADEIDPEARTGWSVVVHGIARIVTHPAREEQLYGQQVEPWTAADRRTIWIELDAPTISGRRVD